ncbi:ankyrin [Aspergillus sclerotiicarbonarius CBS 121057]|uniref:Ankyrin n=1 Tax=Aspergillus sclerotiicarbonarius (strain CBS 121057 / IBT 28362) TaxID=1448318 RepID=A0A319E4S3_ASPSB|nr:ankyrin [Aspergillus sclerotiicarbonarius CBS 121057]
MGICSLLLVHNAKVNNNGGYYGTSLQAAAYRGHFLVVEALIAADADIRYPGRFRDAFHAASEAGRDKSMTLLLIDRHVDVNLTGHYFGTALQAVARFGHLGCVMRLLDAGADANLLEGSHGTPLQAAVKGGHIDVVRALISRGADVNIWREPAHEDKPKKDSCYEQAAFTPAIKLANSPAMLALLEQSGAYRY